MANKYLSKLCKENKPEACIDCLSIRCNCICHKKNIWNDDDDNTCEMLEREISFDD